MALQAKNMNRQQPQGECGSFPEAGGEGFSMKVTSEQRPRGPWKMCGEEHSRLWEQQLQKFQAGDKSEVFEEKDHQCSS